MNYENFKSDGQDDNDVAQMLARLQRVEAPGDFDQRVKARIARASAAPRRFPFLRLAIPIGVLGALVAVFFLAGIFTQPIDQVQVVPEMPDRANGPGFAVNDPQPSPGVDANTEFPKTGQKPNDTQLAGTQPGNLSQPLRSKSNRIGQGGGSKDMTSKVPGKSILPRGFDTDVKVTKVPPPGFNTNSRVSAADVLKLIGIDAEFRSGAWIANSIRANSPAERAGMKPKDEIEALDNRQISQATTFTGAVNFKTIRVKRDGKTLRLGF